VLGAAAGQHHDADVRTLAKMARHRDAVFVRQPQVQHGQVEAIREHAAVELRGAAQADRVETEVPQPGHEDVVAQLAIVLQHGYPPSVLPVPP